MSERVNKTFQRLLASTVTERETVTEALLRITQGGNYLLVDADNPTEKENARLKLKIANLEREIRTTSEILEDALIGLVNHKTIRPKPKSDKFGRIKEWIVEEMRSAGAAGLSRREMRDREPLHRQDITRRWKEIQNEGYGFPLTDDVMVHVDFKNNHPVEYAEYMAGNTQRIREAANV